MGLGTYPRIVLAKKPPGKAQTNFELKHERGFNYLALKAGLPLYFGQKVAIDRFANYRISLSLRSPDGRGALVVVLCEKLLLYSSRCRGAGFRPKMSGAWEQVNGMLPAIGLDGRPLFGRLRRPVEFAIFDAFPTPNSILQRSDWKTRLAAIFWPMPISRTGSTRWFFTDDNHAIWRMENQYLMSFFETGALGLAAFLLFAGAACWAPAAPSSGAIRVRRRSPLRSPRSCGARSSIIP